MAYCTVQDVQGEFKSLVLSASSTPTDTAVLDFIARASAEIDGRIGLKYQTPVDATASPNGYAILRDICLDMVSRKIRRIIAVKTGDSQTSQDSSEKPGSKNPSDRLNDIVQSLLLLSDVQKINVTDGIRSNAFQCRPEHFFQRGVDQW